MAAAATVAVAAAATVAVAAATVAVAASATEAVAAATVAVAAVATVAGAAGAGATVVGLQLTTDVAHAAQSPIALVNAQVMTRSAAERP